MNFDNFVSNDTICPVQSHKIVTTSSGTTAPSSLNIIEGAA